ncbi:MAG: CpsB/CapC family capsule biosynthesis tyrosine phosphatase [Mycobacterium sp.]|nr:CpsB/CapC family capsule biosynthesis tyrosine phosphatase [Mycobacterium sp.]
MNPTGWVDCHSHLLAGVDDGPSSPDDSLKMLADAAAGGTRLLFVTSHLDERMPWSRERANDVERAFGQLLDLATQVAGCPELRMGYELAPRPGTAEFLADPAQWRLPGTDVVLVDGPDDIPMRHDAGILSYVDKVVAAGLRPLLAHPERRAFLFDGDRDFAYALKSKGALLQVDSGAFLGLDGSAVAAEAHRLLEEELVDVVASDAHEVGEADLRPVHRHLYERIGDRCETLLNGTILEDR